MGYRTGPIVALGLLLIAATWTLAQGPTPGEGPALGAERMTQDQIVSGELDLEQIRRAGMRIFTTLFNKLDGHGDGPLDPVDPLQPGGRPTLQGNGTFLRVNGLDSQGCIECHTIVSAATMPPTLGIGGAGSSNNNAIIKPSAIDVADLDGDAVAGFDGRFANPPFVFGAGAVELLAAEMTEDLQKMKQRALDQPGRVVELSTKGVSFGSIVADRRGELDTSLVEGVADDLVVRPFGRKGEFFSIRAFDVDAMQFHFGMQPIEAVGEGYDDDGDEVVDEILIGELSALSIFVATIDRPVAEPLTGQAARGFTRFESLGCAECHVPALETRSSVLGLRFPELPAEPRANVFYEVDLAETPGFPTGDGGGLVVPLFADLKRHDMGPLLAEDFALADEATNREFTTARLWGIADSAPYLHDGRATTLTEAILAHGGEAEPAREAFAEMNGAGKMQLLAFLRSLRTPHSPLEDLLGADADENDDDEAGP